MVSGNETWDSVNAIDPLGDSPESKLVKALLSVEWRKNGGGTITCPGCGSWTFNPRHVRPEQTMDKIGCYIDEALTAAGYPDHDSREAGRQIISDAERRRREILYAERRLAWADRQEFDRSG